MDSTPKPHDSKGQRYLWCHNYDHCLDVAIEKKWSTFSCDDCFIYHEYLRGCGNRQLSVLLDMKVRFDCADFGSCYFLSLNNVDDMKCSKCKDFKFNKMSIENSEKIEFYVRYGSIRYDFKCAFIGFCYHKKKCDLSKLDCEICLAKTRL